MSYCRNLVRTLDYDRYLACLLAPGPAQDGLFALYGFAAEIARIRDLVSEPGIGEIRLQWWQDTLAQIYSGDTPDQPLAIALGDAITAHDLPRRALENLISARRFDLYDDPMTSLNELEGYLGETSSVLLQLAAGIVAGKQTASAVSELAGLGGVAYGLCGLLRALPYHRARGQCYVPADLLSEYGLTPAHLIAGRESREMAQALLQLCQHAGKRLDEARMARRKVEQAALPAFLPLCLVAGDLKRLEKAELTMLKGLPKRLPLVTPWQLWRHSMGAGF